MTITTTAPVTMAIGTFLAGFLVSPARNDACCHPPYEKKYTNESNTKIGEGNTPG